MIFAVSDSDLQAISNNQSFCTAFDQIASVGNLAGSSHGRRTDPGGAFSCKAGIPDDPRRQLWGSYSYIIRIIAIEFLNCFWIEEWVMQINVI